MDWNALIEHGPAGRLAEECGRLLGIPIPAEGFRKQCRSAAGPHAGELGYCAGNLPWSENSWRSWFKCRAMEMELYPIGSAREPRPAVSAVLHVGFLSIEESPEQLERLRRREPDERAGPARSRIGKTTQVIRPVDIVAARVVPGLTARESS